MLALKLASQLLKKKYLAKCFFVLLNVSKNFYSQYFALHEITILTRISIIQLSSNSVLGIMKVLTCMHHDLGPDLIAVLLAEELFMLFFA